MPKKSRLEKTNSQRTSVPHGTGLTKGGRVIRLLSWMLVVTIAACGIVSLRADEMWVKYAHFRAKGLFQAYRDSEAIELLRGALAIDRSNVQTHLLLARAYRRQEEHLKSLEYLGSAALLGADPSQIEIEKRLTYIQSGRIREAKAGLSQLLVEHSELGQDILQAFAIGFLVNQTPADSLGLLDKWQEAFPLDAKACYLKGIIFTDYRRLPDAIGQFRRGLQLDPRNADMHVELIDALMENGQNNEAYDAIAHGRTHIPNEAKLDLIEARYTFDQRNFARTAELLERCLKSDPQNLKARLLRGRTRLEVEEAEKAVADLQFVIQREPTNTQARELMGRCMQRLGMKTAAAEHFEYANQSTRAQNEILRLTRKLQDEPNNVELQFEIAQLSNQFISQDDAAKWMHLILEIQPGHVGALRGLVDYYKSKGDSNKSYELQRLLSEQGRMP